VSKPSSGIFSLALFLFVFWIIANHHNLSLSSNNPTFFTDFFY
jgi:hypothetical protein